MGTDLTISSALPGGPLAVALFGGLVLVLVIARLRRR
jgi:hypothetical protein